MKKLYSLLSAVAVCSLSAAAVNPAVQSTFTADNVCAKAEVTVSPAKAPSKAPQGEWNVVGEGKWSDDLLPQVSTMFMPGAEWNVTVEESATTAGWYRLVVYNENSSWYNIMEEADDVYLYINATNPEKVYMEDFAALGGEYLFCERVPESAEFSNGGWGAGVFGQDGEFYGKLENGIITFVTDGICYVGENAEGGRSAYFSNRSGLTKLALPGHEFPAQFADYGTATFQNAILAPYFAETDALLAGELIEGVQVLKGIENTNEYRFVGAWNLNGLESEWPLTVDVTNPGYGAMGMQGTGVEGDEGLLQVCGFYTFMLDYSAQPMTHNQFITSEYKDQVIVFDAASNVITFKKNSVMHNSPEGSTPNQWGWWKDEYAYPSVMTMTANSGINDITVDNSNAPVEFYNLQGIRVENPANGIYIRRQGTNTSKVFIR